MIRPGIAVALVISLGAAPAFADELSKEACIDAHSKGQDAKEQGKLSLARKLFLSCAQSSCPALVQGDCARFADDLTRLQPSLSFVARDGGGADLPDTSVYIDGMLTVTQLGDGRAHDIDPGAHAIKFVHGMHEQTMTIVVGAGEKGRTISATFDDTNPSARKGAGAGALAMRREPPKPVVKTSHPFGAKMLIGGGAVLLAGGTGLGILGLTRVPDNCSVSSHQCAAPPGDKSFGDASSAIKLSNIGWVTAGVGVAALAGGVAWYVGGAKSHTEQNLVGMPWVTPEAAGFAVMGHL